MINKTDKLKEECGVLGIYSCAALDENNECDENKKARVAAARKIYFGLFALQHRGQQSCGIASCDAKGADAKTIHLVKENGLLTDVFTEKNLATLEGNIALGHVRYSPRGHFRENAQPIVARYCKGSITLASNGNITNSEKLKEELLNEGAVFQSTNEVEVMMHLIARERPNSHSIENAVKKVMKRLEGSYSMVLMSPRKLVAARDPKGFRPLCLGKAGNDYIVASESVAFDVMGAKFIRDIEPGEIIVIEKGGITSHKEYCNKEKPSLCVFEYIYFARPDSVIDGVSVYNARMEIGRRLAKAHPVKADLVIGVPDSGLNFAHGFSDESGIPYGDGLIRNRYTGRTFIKETQKEREEAVALKLNPLRANIEGKRIIMIDDSIVRGTTTQNLVKILKKAGAKEVHIRIGSPPFLNPCYFGTDIPSGSELASVKYTHQELTKKLGADSLGFLPIDDLEKIGLRKDFGYCNGCFSGKYPIKIHGK
ncbi:MAG: amidophosphoribosyltransferase [Firmicutes bacterium]|nr:amidophosphoribosyltransferase [Bacillota bacterium]